MIHHNRLLLKITHLNQEKQAWADLWLIRLQITLVFTMGFHAQIFPTGSLGAVLHVLQVTKIEENSWSWHQDLLPFTPILGRHAKQIPFLHTNYARTKG